MLDILEKLEELKANAMATSGDQSRIDQMVDTVLEIDRLEKRSAEIKERMK